MSHKEIKQQLQLLLYNELDPAEQSTVEQHLKDCEECQKEFVQLKRVFEIIETQRTPELTEQLINEARHELHSSLISQRTKPSLWKDAVETIDSIIASISQPGNLPRYAYAFSGIAIFAIGILLGYATLTLNSGVTPIPVKSAVDTDILKNPDYEITNVQFVNSDTSDGKVEVAFDAVRHMKMKGNVDDENVKKLLAHSLTNESNPGARLKSLNIIKAYQLKLSDKDMKTALIKVLKADDNAGVRKVALEALEQLPYDSDIKESFLYVLINDNNPGLRISAIDGLVTKAAGQVMDSEILKTLREKVYSDNNKYIRVRAQNLIEDIKQ